MIPVINGYAVLVNGGIVVIGGFPGPSPVPVSSSGYTADASPTVTGSLADMVWRLRAVLPPTWFPDTGPGQATQSPVLDAALAGIGWLFGRVYAMLRYARVQSRIATCTDMWLDLVSRDFFARRLPRFQNEGDASFRVRIIARLFRDVATRPAVAATVTRLTGRAPTVIEPANTGDCGAYAGSGAVYGGTLAWGSAGYWGSVALPCQTFMQVHRPDGSAGVAAGSVTDGQIYTAIAETMLAGTVAWVNIAN